MRSKLKTLSLLGLSEHNRKSNSISVGCQRRNGRGFGTQDCWAKRLVAFLRSTIPGVSVTANSATRVALLLGVAVDLVLIAVRVFLYRPFLAMPGGLTFVIEPVTMLIVYGVLVLWITTTGGLPRQSAIARGTIFGLITGALQVTHMTLENFVDLGPRLNGITTLTFMFCAFMLWGVAGYVVARSTKSIFSGITAAVWSAVVSTLITVTFGFALMYSSVPRPEYVATWAEFKRSGWTDARAFAIANTLDAGFSHLIIAPIVGIIFGAIGAAMASWRPTPPPDPTKTV